MRGKTISTGLPAAGEPGRRVRSAVALAARGLVQLGMPRALDLLWGGRRITILAYHRIADVHAANFHYLADNVSASPAMFAAQMQSVQRHFNVIDLETLIGAVTRGQQLPERALLITFDDGYYDNYRYAYPVLKQLGLPAVCFIITGQMGVSTVPWWDAVAYSFRRSAKPQASLPLIGDCDLSTAQRRGAARNKFLATMKLLPDAVLDETMAALTSALEVAPPANEPHLFMDWDHVRELSANGITCQPHTVSHPILTRISPERMRYELTKSFADIQEQTGRPAVAFAYPNGRRADYSAKTMEALRELGCNVAFTLSPRMLFPSDLQRRPFELPRIYLNYRDSPDVFMLKIMGLLALGSRA